MDVRFPATAVSPGPHAHVLVALARTEHPLTGRRIARLVGDAISHATVARALEQLVEHGLVHRVDQPPAALYTLNREHVAAEAVLHLASLRTRLLDRITAAVSTWPLPPVNATLFGSAARGDGDTSSDVDLLLVRPDTVADQDERWLDQLDALSVSVLAWSGNAANLVEFTAPELAEAATSGMRLVDEIRRDGIHLHGRRLSEVLRPTRASA